MNILGISAFYHDSAAAIVVDGDIVAAAQEERFTRKKHDAGFPSTAVAYCLEEAGNHSRRTRLHRVLRQALAEVRTVARDATRVRAERLPQLRHGHARMAQGKVDDAPDDPRPACRASRVRRSSSWITTKAMLPARSFRVRSKKRRFSRSTASANGRQPLGASDAATRSS